MFLQTVARSNEVGQSGELPNFYDALYNSIAFNRVFIYSTVTGPTPSLALREFCEVAPCHQCLSQFAPDPLLVKWYEP